MHFGGFGNWNSVKMTIVVIVVCGDDGMLMFGRRRRNDDVVFELLPFVRDDHVLWQGGLRPLSLLMQQSRRLRRPDAPGPSRDSLEGTATARDDRNGRRPLLGLKGTTATDQALPTVTPTGRLLAPVVPVPALHQRKLCLGLHQLVVTP